MESDIFSILKDESYEDNRWTRLIADRLGIDVKYLWIAPNAEQQTQKFNAALQQERYRISFVSIN